LESCPHCHGELHQARFNGIWYWFCVRCHKAVEVVDEAA